MTSRIQKTQSKGGELKRREFLAVSLTSRKFGESTKLCTRCKRNPGSRRASGWHCPDCARLYDNAYYRVHREKRNASARHRRGDPVEIRRKEWAKTAQNLPPRRCPKCGKMKPELDFHMGGYICRVCKSAYDKQYRADHRSQLSRNQKALRMTPRWKLQDRIRHIRFDLAHPARRADYALRGRYGISIQQKVEMLGAQGGVCAICGLAMPGGNGNWDVDHDHVVDLVRGILCHYCNAALGYAKDRPEVLRAMAAYIESWERWKEQNYVAKK